MSIINKWNSILKQQIPGVKNSSRIFKTFDELRMFDDKEIQCVWFESPYGIIRTSITANITIEAIYYTKYTNFFTHQNFSNEFVIGSINGYYSKRPKLKWFTMDKYEK